MNRCARFLLVCWFCSSLSFAATLPTGFTELQFGGASANFADPTAMAFAPDGRLFICQQGGALRIIKNGQLLAQPFHTLTVNASGERGLLGLAFDPNFASNQFIYLYYTTSGAPIHNRVSRFTANGDLVVPGSEVVLLDLNNLSGATNHNGGALYFGGDGKLYIAVGDNAASSNSQTLNNLLGKILRINADGSIPNDNPFFNTATGVNRSIWALGLRNPFTFNIQPVTNRMFINDVGQNTWEEINDGMAGSNYGWPTCEGNCNPANANFRDPLHAYVHTAGACAITGGVFYNPTFVQFPGSYVGKYFFADYCAGFIRYLDASNNSVTNFATGTSFPVDLKVGPDGSLYYLQRGNGGQVWRIEYTANAAPMITQHPANVTIPVGQAATFTVAASGAPTLNYQWQRNTVNIPNATGMSYTLNNAQLSDSGALFRCVVTNGSGMATSNEATLTVTSNQSPTATITQPLVDTTYSGGQLISYAGTGTDPETGMLPASAFTWEVAFHHDEHTHPFILPTTGSTGGSFTIPTVGHTETNVWYRIRLTVRDITGLEHTATRDIFPRTAQLTLTTNPPGLQVTLDGQPAATPLNAMSVVGVERTLGVVSPQTVGGATYQFTNWSDGGAVTHTIATPAANTTYTATFSCTSNCPMITANPNPVALCNGATTGMTTISWNAPGVSSTRVHVGSPTGALFATGAGSGSAATGNWVTNGLQFFLLHAANNAVLASTTVTTTTNGCNAGTLTASPNPIQVCDGTGLGITTLTWNAPGAQTVQVRVNTPTGALFTQGGAAGSQATGKWVVHGMQFFLVNAANGTTLASTTVNLTTANCASGGTLTATPNPIQVCDGTGLGVTTITWNAPGIANTRIHVGSPSGPLFAGGYNSGAAMTGKWVSNGMTFYLVNAATGATLATATANLTTTGCTGGPLTANPNPIQVCNGSGLGITTLHWNAPAGVTATQLRVGSAAGPLFAQGGPVGSQTTGLWVTNGLQFFLQNISNGAPGVTLGTTTVTHSTTGCRP